MNNCDSSVKIALGNRFSTRPTNKFIHKSHAGQKNTQIPTGINEKKNKFPHLFSEGIKRSRAISMRRNLCNFLCLSKIHKKRETTTYWFLWLFQLILTKYKQKKTTQKRYKILKSSVKQQQQKAK